MTKKPSKPPPSNASAKRHDSETSTVIARAVDPALLRAAGKGARPPVPRPDPSRPNKPTSAEPSAKATAPQTPAAPPVAPERASAASNANAEISFADLDKHDAPDHTVAVRGFVLPRGALPNDGAMPSPLGSEYAFDAVRVPTFPPQPDAFSSVPPAPMPGPVKFPSDITRIAMNVSDLPPSPASSNPPPSSSQSPPSSRSGPPSARGRALAATMDSPRTKVPTLLVDRSTLLAARAVDKRESILLASVDGKLDVEALAGETGFLPSETVEIVMTLVARGILSVK